MSTALQKLKLLGENIAALVCSRKRGTIDLCIMKQQWRYFISNLVQIFTQMIGKTMYSNI